MTTRGHTHVLLKKKWPKATPKEDKRSRQQEQHQMTKAQSDDNKRPHTFVINKRSGRRPLLKKTTEADSKRTIRCQEHNQTTTRGHTRVLFLKEVAEGHF